MNKFGYVCFVGRPNVGKSTLTNHYLKIPIAIESPRPQTTWYLVRGLYTEKNTQIVFTDTPGIHRVLHRNQNRVMNKIAYSALSASDIICQLVTPEGWTKEDQHIYDFIQEIDKPKILVINQVDRFSDKKLFPFI